jgi:hypothetical protein
MRDDDEHRFMEALQREFCQRGTSKIITQNRENIGRYAHAIRSQSMQMLRDHFNEILDTFNAYHQTHFEPTRFMGIDKAAVVMHMLKSNNLDFVREMMQQLVTIDVATVDNAGLNRLRDNELRQYERSLSQMDVHEQSKLWMTCEDRLKIKMINHPMLKDSGSFSKIVGQLLQKMEDYPLRSTLLFPSKELGVVKSFIQDLRILTSELADGAPVQQQRQKFIEQVSSFQTSLEKSQANAGLHFVKTALQETFYTSSAQNYRDKLSTERIDGEDVHQETKWTPS